MEYTEAGTFVLVSTAVSILLAVLAANYGYAAVRRKTGKAVYGTIAAVVIFFVAWGVLRAVSRLLLLGHY